MGDLGAIEDDVPFDFGVASTFATACDNAATSVEGQSGSRASWVTTGSTDFKGHFSELFTANAAVAAGDASELASRLREVATGVRKLAEEARKEQQRRETARAWKKEHDDRNAFEQFGDWLTGGDDPPVGPPAAEPTIAVSSPVNRTRQTPPPGSGGSGGGGTSSARPSNLRTFATSSKGANDELRPKPGILRADFSSFQGSCRWGRLDASGVFVGFDKWLAANDEDVRWATTVADAFAAAGGEGNVSTVSNSAIAAALHAAGVHASRTDLTIEPPQAYGNPPTTGYANDPVNTSTGNFVENETDLAFPGAAALLVWGRSYNSADPGSAASSAGAFGLGWSSIVEAGLVLDGEEGVARFRLPDGRRLVFPRLADGWDRAVGENLWLTHSPAADETAPDGSAGALRVAGTDGAWWSLGADGTLLAYGSGPVADGNLVRLVRDETGRLIRLEHGRGRTIELTWGQEQTADRIVAASSSDGRQVSYGYDAEGRLLTASGPLGTRSYRWAEFARVPLIAAVVDADGVVEVENDYDAQRRVIRQRSPFGRTTRFAYLPGRVTVVSDDDGTRSNTWIADDRGRLVGVVDAAEQRQSTSYDGHGNPVLLTERDGATTVHEYDRRGRRIRTVTPTGADLTWGYDDADRPTTVVTETGAVTELAYTADRRNPSTVTDPEGGVTRLDWDRGLLWRVTDPTGVVVAYDYDDHGDLTAVTDADGNTARLERDPLGRVTAAVTPSGNRTTYTYDDDSGLLVARTNPDGATWRYDHTPGGRLTTVVDPMGGRTSIEHGTHGEETRTVDPLGRAVTRSLDDLGNLAAVELPDGSTWRFTHDALSRLTATTDPTGGVWRREYDTAGNLAAALDPTGGRRGVAVDQESGRVTVDDGDVSVTTGYDPLGRATSLGRPDGSAAMAVYDLCGRPVELLDADGGLTLVERDPAGRPVATTNPTGAVTRYTYDRCGRLAAVVDALGARTRIEYDADGQAVRQTLPTGETVTAGFDVCGRVVSLHRPGAGTTSYTYDSCGRVVATQDPRHGRRLFTYDPAGQLIAVTDGNGGVTRYTYDDCGRAVEITNPVGGITRREFDALNRCVAETDPLGRTTRAGYDGAGHLVWQENPDGRRLTWTYDAAGRPTGMAVDGGTVTALTRNPRARTLQIEDRTGDRPVQHELEWNGRGQLLRRARDGRAVTWAYDANGRRTAMTTPDGATTRYHWDAADRLTAIDHPLLGRAGFDRDATGRLVAATAGDIIQSWDHTDGHVTAHTVTTPEGATRTRIERDDQGRIGSITRDHNGAVLTTDYSYDAAGQLTQARTRRSDDGSASPGERTLSRPQERALSQSRGRGASAESVATWRYDAAGRLVAETLQGPESLQGVGTDEATVRHVYDLAGQLLATIDADDHRISYRYDGAGRRVEAADHRGTRRTFTWNATGYLAGISDHAGDRVRSTRVHADALGELADVDGTLIFWDTAAYVGAPVLVGDTPILAGGPITGIGADWTTPGWRTSRSTDTTDPWSTTGTHALPGGDSVDGLLGVSAGGDLSVGGLEWLGARVYDPAARGFLSTDPQEPTTGAGWSGNPYSYAGNDPLHALDPAGLHPVTDAELQAYRDSNGLGGALNTAWNATKDWMADNWEYVAGGAMVIAGGVLIATGVGGPVGMMLVSAGADTIIQKATTGSVDWGQVAVSGVLGGVGGGAAIAAKAGATGLRAAVITGAYSGAVGGAGSGGYSYMRQPGPHSVGGFLGATAAGAGAGALMGGAGGAAGHGIAALGGRALSSVRPTPVELPASDIRFSQRSVNGAADIEQSMRANGWVGDPIDVVHMQDGGLTSLDNTRLLAAKRAEIPVLANLRGHDDPLPDHLVDRFTTKKGGAPATWGDAATNRINNQGAAYRDTNPNGSWVIGWDGN